MAKHDTDPVLRQLIRAVNESENATVPSPSPCTVCSTPVGPQLAGPPGRRPGKFSRETIKPSLICLKLAHLVVPSRDLAVPMEHRAGSMRPDVPKVRWRAALTGVLLGERLYFGELAGQNPLMAALEPASGLLGKDQLWRISLEAVDAWTLPVPAGDTDGRQGTVRAPSEQPLTASSGG
jgi:hypothetical protein